MPVEPKQSHVAKRIGIFDREVGIGGEDPSQIGG
jgi:hypothetical protein